MEAATASVETAPRRAGSAGSPPSSSAGRGSAWPALLVAPLGWLLIAYLGSLVVLFVAAFWRLDPFTAEVIHDYSFSNFRTLWDADVCPTIALRTIGIAAAVTVIDAVLAFPIAFYMAKVASPRTRSLLIVAILMPLWASYLVKVYAWRIILQGDRPLNWALDPFPDSRGRATATWPA